MEEKWVDIRVPRWMAVLITQIAAMRGITVTEALGQLLKEGFEVVKQIEKAGDETESLLKGDG